MFPPMSLKSALRVAGALVASALCVLAAGAAQAQVATQNTLNVGVRVPGFPHKVDVYRPAGATRAVVFMHGHGGRNWQVAYELGLNLRKAPVVAKQVDWARLQALGVIAIFPQGQVPAGTTQPTWSNHVFDSGQDDVAFLSALSAHARQQWGAVAVGLAGHSSGGAMAARMWCEATTAYDGYFSVAGPMSTPSYPAYGPTCTPLAPRPYTVAIGDRDAKLAEFAVAGLTPTPAQVAAGLVNGILASEWYRHDDRAQGVCGDQVPVEAYKALAVGNLWSACNGRIAYTVVRNAEHGIGSVEQRSGVRVFDWAAAATIAAGSASPR